MCIVLLLILIVVIRIVVVYVYHSICIVGIVLVCSSYILCSMIYSLFILLIIVNSNSSISFNN